MRQTLVAIIPSRSLTLKLALGSCAQKIKYNNQMMFTYPFIVDRSESATPTPSMDKLRPVSLTPV